MSACESTFQARKPPKANDVGTNRPNFDLSDRSARGKGILPMLRILFREFRFSSSICKHNHAALTSPPKLNEGSLLRDNFKIVLKTLSRSASFPTVRFRNDECSMAVVEVSWRPVSTDERHLKIRSPVLRIGVIIHKQLDLVESLSADPIRILCYLDWPNQHNESYNLFSLSHRCFTYFWSQVDIKEAMHKLKVL